MFNTLVGVRAASHGVAGIATGSWQEYTLGEALAAMVEDQRWKKRRAQRLEKNPVLLSAARPPRRGGGGNVNYEQSTCARTEYLGQRK